MTASIGKKWSNHENEYMRNGVLDLANIPTKKLVKYHIWDIRQKPSPSSLETQFRKIVRESLIQSFKDNKLSAYHLLLTAAADQEIPYGIVKNALEQFVTTKTTYIETKQTKCMNAINTLYSMQVPPFQNIIESINVEASNGTYFLNKSIWSKKCKNFEVISEKYAKIPLTVNQLENLTKIFTEGKIKFQLEIDEALKLYADIQFLKCKFANNALFAYITKFETIDWLLHNLQFAEKNNLEDLKNHAIAILAKKKTNHPFQLSYINLKLTFTIKNWNKNIPKYLKTLNEVIDSISFNNAEDATAFIKNIKECSFPKVQEVPTELTSKAIEQLHDLFPNATNLEGPSKRLKVEE